MIVSVLDSWSHDIRICVLKVEIPSTTTKIRRSHLETCWVNNHVHYSQPKEEKALMESWEDIFLI